MAGRLRLGAQVHVNVDSSANFTQYKTFAFASRWAPTAVATRASCRNT